MAAGVGDADRPARTVRDVPARLTSRVEATGRTEGLRCTVTLEAEPHRLGLVRHVVSVWLTAVGWPGQSSSQIVSAVSEAVSNTVEHAYTSDPGPVRIAMRLECAHERAERVRLVVSDRGRWRAGGPEPGRGNGIRLMQALCATVDVATDAHGTRVTLLSDAVTSPLRR